MARGPRTGQVISAIEPACCIVPFSNLCSTFETVCASEHVRVKSEPRAQFLVFSSGVDAKSDPKSPGADMYAHWSTV